MLGLLFAISSRCESYKLQHLNSMNLSRGKEATNNSESSAERESKFFNVYA